MAPEVRHRVMASIRKVNTKPELALRRALTTGGLKGYRIDVAGLLGRPDIAYSRWRVAVFVDGVFWHGHPDHFRFGTLGSYWDEKMARNQARDQKVTRALTDEGWTVLRLWDLDVLADPLKAAELVSKALQARGRTAHP